MSSAVSKGRFPRTHEYWQWARDLPRPWIVLPVDVREAALSRPLSQHLLPSHVGFFPEARLHDVRRHGITSTIFKYCVHGNGWCELEGKHFEVRPGDLLVVPEGLPHAYGSSKDRPWTIHWFHAVGDYVGHVLRELGVAPEHPVVHLGKSPELVALFVDLERTMSDNCTASGLVYASQLLTHLLGLMIRLGLESPMRFPDARQRVLVTAAQMRDHPQQTLDVEQAASMAGLSVSHYSALFRELTGAPPLRYLNKMRMVRACQLLAETDESIKTISNELGFEDQLYFSRVFRALNDVSPSKFRRARKTKE